jgi:uncharacterized protein YdhG (YjbR/CyaY superfamily)
MNQHVDQYISDFPDDIQKRLQQIRSVIKKAAPEATECISYGIPTFKLNGNLVHYGGFKKHIGFFPTAKGIETFTDQLKKYPTTKGTVQFMHDQPLPLELIKKIVTYRVKENNNNKSSKRNLKQPISKSKST